MKEVGIDMLETSLRGSQLTFGKANLLKGIDTRRNSLEGMMSFFESKDVGSCIIRVYSKNHLDVKLLYIPNARKCK